MIRKMNTLQIHSLSLAGEHGANEDACLSCFHPRRQNAVLCAVSDGQGGQPGGGVASSLACEAIVGLASECSPLRLHWPITWRSIARRTDRRVRAAPGAGFCTLVALAVTPRRISGAACGDSAAVLAVGDEATRFLTSEQDKNPPVGSGKASFTYFSARISPGKPWTLLLMTDGVWKFTGLDPVIEAAISREPAPRIIDQLRAAALRNGHLLGRSLRDDFTVTVVQNRPERRASTLAELFGRGRLRAARVHAARR